jgi:L-threonylcarbamoyladenylate synthase
MIILAIEKVGLNEAAKKAAEVLSKGGIVLFPTDTLYGLAVDGRDIIAAMHLKELKGRAGDKFISVVVKDKEMIKEYAVIPSEAERLIDSYLPGPLTIALPSRGKELAHLATDDTVRVRIPDDSFTLSLSKEFNAPYTATSANLSGFPTMHTVSEILAQFGEDAEKIDLVIDGGARGGEVPSTVVRVVEGEPEIVREGALSREDLGL